MTELNGRPVGVEQLQSLALTNYGHFTSFRVDDGCVRGLSMHLDRLDRDCRAVFGVPLDGARVRHLTRRMMPARGAATIRITVYDPAIDLGRPAKANDPQILVNRRPASPLPLPPLTVRSASFARDTPEIKSVGLFGALRQRRLAQLHGYDDALFLDGAGRVCEGGTWNVGFFDGDHVVWPAAPCLPGITMQLLRHTDQRILPVTRHEMVSMKVAFATNAAIGVRAITRIDDMAFPAESEILDNLRTAYLAIAPEAV